MSCVVRIVRQPVLALLAVLTLGGCGHFGGGSRTADCAQTQASTRVTGCSPMDQATLAGAPTPIAGATAYAPASIPGFRPWTDAVEYEFRFVIGDELAINLPFYEEETTTTTVAPDGNIYLSLIGPVPAEGRTPGELEADLESRYEKYLRFPTVGVVPKSYGNRQVFVGGEVNRPGALNMPGPMGVMEAVIMAGGLKETAGTRKVALIRRGPEGYPMMRIVDLDEFTSMATAEQNLILQPYDVVFVPRSRIAEVNLWVDQFINKTVPFNRNFSFTIQKDLF